MDAPARRRPGESPLGDRATARFPLTLNERGEYFPRTGPVNTDALWRPRTVAREVRVKETSNGRAHSRSEHAPDSPLSFRAPLHRRSPATAPAPPGPCSRGCRACRSCQDSPGFPDCPGFRVFRGFRGAPGSRSFPCFRDLRNSRSLRAFPGLPARRPTPPLPHRDPPRGRHRSLPSRSPATAISGRASRVALGPIFARFVPSGDRRIDGEPDPATGRLRDAL